MANLVSSEPDKPSKAQRPPALDQTQYELYEGEDQPWGVHLADQAPRHVSVVCQLCGTRMDVAEKHLGKQLVCPDCGTKTRIAVQPPAEKTKAPRLTDEAVEVEAAQENTLARFTVEEYLSRSRLGQEVASSRGAAAPPREAPSGALYRRAFTCWKSPGLIAVWLTVSVMGILVFCVLGGSVGGGAGVVSLGLGAIAGVLLLVVLLAISVLVAGVLAKILIELLSESSVGGDRVREWPTTDASEWLGPLVTLVVAGVVAAAPALLLLGGILPGGAPRLVWLSLWLGFPLVLLSQLESGSVWGVLSPPIVRTLSRFPLRWIAFYALSYPLVCGPWELVAEVAANRSMKWMYALIPLSLFATITYARVLGLHAWVLESLDRSSADASDSD
ncbi:hypothetical protein [Botrimarina hoheduenensis]|uniref:hypothetical protein n=1 Tax=Botrimarina hoheduenensis TaxID=2528000 RepID=UPI0011B83E1A|nr:hypothetical protein [Botrimarina hoheduenensis]